MVGTIGAPSITNPTPSWFKFKDIPLPSRRATMVNNIPACLFSSTERDLATKEFEHALVIKFSTGKPTLPEIKLYICLNWNLKAERVILFIDPRHVLILSEEMRKPKSNWKWPLWIRALPRSIMGEKSGNTFKRGWPDVTRTWSIKYIISLIHFSQSQSIHFILYLRIRNTDLSAGESMPGKPPVLGLKVLPTVKRRSQFK